MIPEPSRFNLYRFNRYRFNRYGTPSRRPIRSAAILAAAAALCLSGSIAAAQGNANHRHTSNQYNRNQYNANQHNANQYHSGQYHPGQYQPNRNNMSRHPMMNHTGAMGGYGASGRQGAGMNSQMGTAGAISGRVAGLDLQTRTFNVVQGRQSTAVDASHATIRYHGQFANMNRLLGSPTVRVQGFLRTRTRLIQATHVDILTPPAARLQRSRYTNRAKPPIHKLEPATRRRR